MAEQSRSLVVILACAWCRLAPIVWAFVLGRRVVLLVVFLRLHGRHVEVVHGIVVVALSFARAFAQIIFSQVFLRFIEIEMCEGDVCRTPLGAGRACWWTAA